MVEKAVAWLMALLAIPSIGLGSIFVVSFVSATLLPMGSEPAVFAVVKASENMFWPAVLVATLGNSLGGMVDYWMGYGAKQAFAKERKSTWFKWMEKWGYRSMFFSWLPVIGDPLCTLAGWLKWPFWPSVMYMALGKFLRYVVITWLLLHVPDGFWQSVTQLFD